AVVKVHQEISETNSKGEEKKRIQVFEGIVIARKHGKGINATITVRKVSEGIGVEKIIPLNAPSIKKIEFVKKFQVRQAKPNFLRKNHKNIKEIK
ncbi:MAG: 50S ribosomal protein L19, partial [Patescibacteria group bacterium]